jgi:hypothetical protein
METLSPQQREVARLEAAYPAFQVWVVNRATQPPVWCARPWDVPDQVINAGSAAELEAALKAATS